MVILFSDVLMIGRTIRKYYLFFSRCFRFTHKNIKEVEFLFDIQYLAVSVYKY